MRLMSRVAVLLPLALLLPACKPEAPKAPKGVVAAPETPLKTIPDTLPPAPERSIKASFRCPEPAADGEPLLTLDAPLTDLQTLICGEPELAQLDRRVQEAYIAARLRSGVNRAAMSRAERQWEDSRATCLKAADPRDCVAESSDTRLAELALQDPALRPHFDLDFSCKGTATPLTAAFYDHQEPPFAVLQYGHQRAVVFAEPSPVGLRYTRTGVDFAMLHGQVKVEFYGRTLTCRLPDAKTLSNPLFAADVAPGELAPLPTDPDVIAQGGDVGEADDTAPPQDTVAAAPAAEPVAPVVPRPAPVATAAATAPVAAPRALPSASKPDTPPAVEAPAARPLVARSEPAPPTPARRAPTTPSMSPPPAAPRAAAPAPAPRRAAQVAASSSPAPAPKPAATPAPVVAQHAAPRAPAPVAPAPAPALPRSQPVAATPGKAAADAPSAARVSTPVASATPERPAPLPASPASTPAPTPKAPVARATPAPSRPEPARPARTPPPAAAPDAPAPTTGRTSRMTAAQATDALVRQTVPRAARASAPPPSPPPIRAARAPAAAASTAPVPTPSRSRARVTAAEATAALVREVMEQMNAGAAPAPEAPATRPPETPTP